MSLGIKLERRDNRKQEAIHIHGDRWHRAASEFLPDALVDKPHPKGTTVTGPTGLCAAKARCNSGGQSPLDDDAARQRDRLTRQRGRLKAQAVRRSWLAHGQA